MQRFEGLCFSACVCLCEAVELRYDGEAVRVGDEALVHDGVIFYPHGCSDGAVVRQVRDYRTVDDRFDETACEGDARELERFVRVLRCGGDPSKLLRCLLNDVPLDRHASLLGRTFRVSLGAAADEVAVELQV